MPAGTALSRAIHRLVSDLARLAEKAIADEVRRAVVSASTRHVKLQTQRKAKSAESRREAQRLDAEARAKEKAERAAARRQRKEELARLKQERAALRTAARSARDEAREQARRDKVAQKEAIRKAREDAQRAALAPPPVVVFKRARDGQVTMLKPRPVAANATVEGAPPPVA